MRVLVACATKMGSTREIAERVAKQIRVVGHEVDVADVSEVPDVHPYRAVIVGSALYMTRWRPEAVRFLKRFVEPLRSRQVWLFHSGPLGDRDAYGAQPAPKNVLRLSRRIGADPPVTFGGALRKETAEGFLAKNMVRRGLGGDFRDWGRIDAWGRDIAGRITGPSWVASG